MTEKRTARVKFVGYLAPKAKNAPHPPGFQKKSLSRGGSRSTLGVETLTLIINVTRCHTFGGNKIQQSQINFILLQCGRIEYLNLHG